MYGPHTARWSALSRREGGLQLSWALFTLTGLHAVRVIAGMVVNLFLWGPGVRMWHTNQARFINRVEVAGIYWRFVDLIWIFIFPVLYLL